MGELTLETATKDRTLAARKRSTECSQSNKAELAADSAEGKHRMKQKMCAELEEQEQKLDRLRRAAHVAYVDASREARAANKAHGEAQEALARAQQEYDDASQTLVDAQGVQADAVGQETSECAKAQAAGEKVREIASQLDQANDDLVNARYADVNADNALTGALSLEESTCDAAGKAKCAMSRSRGALDAAKVRYDAAVTARESQE